MGIIRGKWFQWSDKDKAVALAKRKDRPLYLVEDYAGTVWYYVGMLPDWVLQSNLKIINL